MSAANAIVFSYLLGLLAIGIDGWRAHSLARLARERIREEASQT